ncbi:MAG TPA: preprotein translocase subunit SecE [Thermoanaerobaculia bacterium]|nr:preprotein translocase subunit SecE [Thermoanaerobaculia bacterium]
MNVSQKWASFREFLSDVKKESGKVTWPGKDEVVGTTTVVLVYTVLVGVFLFLVDAAVTPLVNKLFAAFGN